MPKVSAETLRLRARVAELEEALRSAEAALARKADIEEQLAHAIKNVNAFRDELSTQKRANDQLHRDLMDARGERDEARNEAGLWRRNLDRCLGWIAKAMDLPPLEPSTGLGLDDQIPF